MIVPALAILCVTQGAWLLYKTAHGGNALGLYGSAARESADLPFSLPLFVAYAFDFFLASGFLCVVPAVYFLGRRWQTERPVVLFYGILFAVQIGWIGVYDGGLAGFVRERLMSFSFPVVAILATRGFVDLQADGPRRWRYWFAGVPLVFLLGLTWRNAAEFTAFETPWAFALSGWFVPALASQAKTVLVVSALGVFALGAAVCLLAGARRATVAFGVFLLVCHCGSLASTAVFGGRHAELSMERESEGLRWLHAHGAGYGARMLVVSSAAAWEQRSAVDQADGLLRGCTHGGGSDPLAPARLETILRWDVRTVCTAKEIERVGRPGDLLLAEEDLAALPGLRPVAALPSTARRLYQISGAR